MKHVFDPDLSNANVKLELLKLKILVFLLKLCICNIIEYGLLFQYYWRDVFVLVSAPYDHYKLVTHACEYNQHDYHGRTINVASVDKTKHHVSASLYGLTLYQ